MAKSNSWGGSFLFAGEGLKREEVCQMGAAEADNRKNEKINGVVYNMSPAPGYQHGITLRAFPHIKMKLKEIFDGLEEEK